LEDQYVFCLFSQPEAGICRLQLEKAARRHDGGPDGLRCRAAAGIGVRRFIRRERGVRACHGHHRGRGHRHSRRRVVPDLGPDGRDERGACRHRRGIRSAGRVFCLLCRGRSAAACGRLQAGSLN